jgi:L-ascorbate metabolism protein UlaG (beta-lactamase superfamily)
MPLYNPELPIIKPDWKGNPTDAQGRFINHEHLFTTSFRDVLKWQTGPKPRKEEKKADDWKPQTIFDIAFLKDQVDCITWLGHAWFYLRLGGKNILIDPVLFKIPFVKQLAPNPYSPMVFTGLDYLLLSHDHRDHADAKSITTLCKLNPQATIITGLGMTPLLRKWCKNRIVEMGWYQQLAEDGLEITFLPTRHWSRRLFTDINRRLWGAFMISGGGKTIYAGQDSGYGSHYAELPTLFPSIDMALLGIGAYQPEWFMAAAHMSPHSAVQAFIDSGARSFFPMHYGMLDLSDEPLGDPIRQVKLHLDKGTFNAPLHIPAIGESIKL